MLYFIARTIPRTLLLNFVDFYHSQNLNFYKTVANTWRHQLFDQGENDILVLQSTPLSESLLFIIYVGKRSEHS